MVRVVHAHLHQTQARWLLHEAPPAAAECLARNLRALARKHVRKEAAACYWYRKIGREGIRGREGGEGGRGAGEG